MNSGAGAPSRREARSPGLDLLVDGWELVTYNTFAKQRLLATPA